MQPQKLYIAWKHFQMKINNNIHQVAKQQLNKCERRHPTTLSALLFVRFFLLYAHSFQHRALSKTKWEQNIPEVCYCAKVGIPLTNIAYRVHWNKNTCRHKNKIDENKTEKIMKEATATIVPVTTNGKRIRVKNNANAWPMNVDHTVVCSRHAVNTMLTVCQNSIK